MGICCDLLKFECHTYFQNKRSLFGLAGKGPWGRITHSEYVIRRYGLHLMTGVEDQIFVKRKDYRRMFLHRLISDIEIYYPL